MCGNVITKIWEYIMYYQLNGTPSAPKFENIIQITLKNIKKMI
jgi:hypothetical protein